MSWQPDAPNPCVPERLQHLCRHYLTWSFANECWGGCHYCLVGAKRGQCNPRSWTYEQAVTGWRNVAEKYGPCQILLSGLEPLAELPLVAEVLKHHYAAVCTNLMVHADALMYAVPADRLELHPSFHPHVWKYDFDGFLCKLLRLRDHGFHVELVALVGWPAALRHWDEWIARLKAEGIMPNPVPARNCVFHGRALPAGYTPEELEILRRYVGDFFTDAGAIKPLQITACAAGVATAGITAEGDVRRCIQVPGTMVGQNLFRDGTLTLLEEPLPCGQAQCFCTNLHPFHVTEARP